MDLREPEDEMGWHASLMPEDHEVGKSDLQFDQLTPLYKPLVLSAIQGVSKKTPHKDKLMTSL